mgnify:CR=1 FL=1
MSHQSLEEKLQAAGGAGRDGPQLADRAVRLPGGAGRVLELAGRAGRLARDVRALRPVAPHDRPLRSRARTRSGCSPTLGVNTLRELRGRTRRSSSSSATTDGYVIGDGILFFLDENRVQPRRAPVGAQLGAVPRRDRRLRRRRSTRDERTAVNPSGRREALPVPGAGPDGARRPREGQRRAAAGDQVLQHGRAHASPGTRCRALHHGMSGVPGLELFGPWDEREDVRAAIVEAGADFGLRQVGSRVYATNTLESGWIPCPLPAVFTGDELKAYREWLPANGYEGTGSLGGELLLGRHRGLLPDAARPRLLAVREVRPRLRRPRGARGDGRPAAREEGHARLERRGRRARDAARCSRRATRRSTSTCRSRTTRPGRTTRCCSTASWSASRPSPGYSYNERSMLSLGDASTVDVEFGTEVTLVWGEEDGGSSKPVVERHVQAEIRAIVSPAPYSEVGAQLVPRRLAHEGRSGLRRAVARSQTRRALRPAARSAATSSSVAERYGAWSASSSMTRSHGCSRIIRRWSAGMRSGRGSSATYERGIARQHARRRRRPGWRHGATACGRRLRDRPGRLLARAAVVDRGAVASSRKHRHRRLALDRRCSPGSGRPSPSGRCARSSRLWPSAGMNAATKTSDATCSGQSDRRLGDHDAAHAVADEDRRLGPAREHIADPRRRRLASVIILDRSVIGAAAG